jgi:hypothetical protein
VKEAEVERSGGSRVRETLKICAIVTGTALLVTLAIPAAVDAAGTLVTLVDSDGPSQAQVDGGKLRVGDGGAKLSVDDGNGSLTVDDGAGALTVDGAVRVVREPFQQFVDLVSSGQPETCEAIVVPAGMRLTIESFSAEVTGASVAPRAYLRTNTTLTSESGTTVLSDRTVVLPMELGSGRWAGHTATLLHSGPASDSTSASYSYFGCFMGTGIFHGLVSGWLEPLS